MEAIDFRKKSPPPLTEVEVTIGSDASTNAREWHLQQSTSVAPANPIGIWQRIKHRFLTGAIIGSVATVVVYSLVRPFTYRSPTSDIFSLGVWIGFFPGWMFRDAVAAGGLGEGPIEKTAEIIFVAGLYGVIAGCVHVVWPARKPPPVPGISTVETKPGVSTKNPKPGPPPLTEVDETN